MYSGEVPTTDPELELTAIQLAISASRLNRYLRHTAPSETTAAMWRTLSILDSHGPLHTTDFAQIDRISQPAATALLRRARDEGFIESHQDPDDGRARLISLSAHGRARLLSLRTEAAARLSPKFAQLSPEEISAIHTATVAINKIVDDFDPLTK